LHACFHISGACHYEERLHQLGLWSLEERWNTADLLEIFKMVKGITATPRSVFFHRAEDKITRGHSWKLVKNHCHCNTRLQFFSQRVINRWNSLTEKDISVSSVNSFKNRLEKRRNHQIDFFKRRIVCLQVLLAARVYTMKFLVTQKMQQRRCQVQPHTVSVQNVVFTLP